MNAFNKHVRIQTTIRAREFENCDDFDSVVDKVEEIAVEIADDLRNKGEWRNAYGHKWLASDAGENLNEKTELDLTLLTQLNDVFGDLIRKPGCLALAIATASPDHRVIFEKLRDLVHGSLGLMCADLAIEKIHYDNTEC